MKRYEFQISWLFGSRVLVSRSCLDEEKREEKRGKGGRHSTRCFVHWHEEYRAKSSCHPRVHPRSIARKLWSLLLSICRHSRKLLPCYEATLTCPSSLKTGCLHLIAFRGFNLLKRHRSGLTSHSNIDFFPRYIRTCIPRRSWAICCFNSFCGRKYFTVLRAIFFVQK